MVSITENTGAVNTHQIDAFILERCAELIRSVSRNSNNQCGHGTALLPATREERDVIDTGRVLDQRASETGSKCRRLGVQYDGQTIRLAISRAV